MDFGRDGGGDEGSGRMTKPGSWISRFKSRRMLGTIGGDGARVRLEEEAEADDRSLLPACQSFISNPKTITYSGVSGRSANSLLAGLLCNRRAFGVVVGEGGGAGRLHGMLIPGLKTSFVGDPGTTVDCEFDIGGNKDSGSSFNGARTDVMVDCWVPRRS